MLTVLTGHEGVVKITIRVSGFVSELRYPPHNTKDVYILTTIAALLIAGKKNNRNTLTTHRFDGRGIGMGEGGLT